MKQRLFKAFSLLLSVMFATQVHAQSISVQGTVSDEFGPVAGASVVVKGTTNGGITNLDGIFNLSDVPSKGTLVISLSSMAYACRRRWTNTIRLSRCSQSHTMVR